MDLGLSGTLALITGGSRGIGRAVGEALAAEGCNLVLVSCSATDLDTAGKRIEGQYRVSIRTNAADLAEGNNAARLAKQYSDVDILINNARAIPGGTLADIDEAHWRTDWDLKVFGTINMARAFYPLMKARGGGVIIHVIGNAARTHDPNYICGVTGNAGLTAFTQAIGSGSIRDNIRVNAVSPGPTATDRLVGLLSKRAQEQFGDPARWRNCSDPCREDGLTSPRRSPPWLPSWPRKSPATPSGAVITLDAGVSSRAGIV